MTKEEFDSLPSFGAVRYTGKDHHEKFPDGTTEFILQNFWRNLSHAEWEMYATEQLEPANHRKPTKEFMETLGQW